MIAVILVAIAAVAFLAGSGQLGPIPGIGGSGEGTSLSDLFHNILDPLGPSGLPKAQADCINVSGSWFDQDDKIGCFNIPPGGFDSSACTGTMASYMKNICESVNDAVWVCESTEVGCKY